MCTLIMHSSKLRNGEVMFYEYSFMQYAESGLEHVKIALFNVKKRGWQGVGKRISQSLK